MMHSRRSFLQSIFASVTVVVAALSSRAWARPTLVSTLDPAIKRQIGSPRIKPSSQITLEVPQIAEDGAVVPITVQSSLEQVDEILVFVEKNPTPLAARFHLNSNLEPFASLRIKRNESCEVIAVVKSRGEYFTSSKAVKVMVGGCG